MLYGRGAGGDPTAAAVVGDLVSAARNLVTGGRAIGCTCALDRHIRPMDDMRGQYYLTCTWPTVPASWPRSPATSLDNGVSIERCGRRARRRSHPGLHHAPAQEGALQKTLQELARVHGRPVGGERAARRRGGAVSPDGPMPGPTSGAG